MSPKEGVMDEVEEFEVPFPDLKAEFAWTVGELMEKFIKAFEDKTLLASECSNCGYTTVPPRCRCPNCNNEMDEDELVELSGSGTLLSYTKGNVELDGEGNFVDLDDPDIIGVVNLEESDSQLVVPLGDANFDDLEIGMDVEIVWSDETEGAIEDIKYFKPK